VEVDPKSIVQLSPSIFQPTTVMSFDAFEARLQFLQLLRKLNASAQSIQKVVGFAVKYGAKCGEDLWEVVMDECEKVSLGQSLDLEPVLLQ
jgi:CTD kinase subunit gamma